MYGKKGRRQAVSGPASSDRLYDPSEGDGVGSWQCQLVMADGDVGRRSTTPIG